jgi:DNA-directed RNA polymerase specialized sigma54-like protein
MKQGLQLRFSQNLSLTPQLQQAIRLLQLSTLELNQEIDALMQTNPLLERDESSEDDYHPEDAVPPNNGEASTSPEGVPETQQATETANGTETDSFDFADQPIEISQPSEVLNSMMNSMNFPMAAAGTRTAPLLTTIAISNSRKPCRSACAITCYLN